jgi:hypothetical protein
VRRPIVMRSRATDGGASKCQQKRPDRPLDHRLGCPR